MPAEDFIITRKRKKFKFARFAELDNCYEMDNFTADILDAFTGGSPVVAEIGAGTGYFLLEQAKQQPDTFFIAIDVKADRLYAGARDAVKQGVANIIFVRAHVDQLGDSVLKGKVSEIWLTFSDPYPKTRHAKHRLTHPRFLAIYTGLFKALGILHFKTDNHGLFDWSLEKFIAGKLQLRRLTFDLHASELPDEYKIMTTYEQRFVAEGLPIYCVDVLLDPASLSRTH